MRQFELPARGGDRKAEQFAILIVLQLQLFLEFANSFLISADAVLEWELEAFQALLKRFDLGFGLTLDIEQLPAIREELLNHLVRQPARQMRRDAQPYGPRQLRPAPPGRQRPVLPESGWRQFPFILVKGHVAVVDRDQRIGTLQAFQLPGARQDKDSQGAQSS